MTKMPFKNSFMVLLFGVSAMGLAGCATNADQERARAAYAASVDKADALAPQPLAAGGDGYSMFVDKPAEYTGLPLRELIADAIRSKKVIDSRVDGRIVRVSD